MTKKILERATQPTCIDTKTHLETRSKWGKYKKKIKFKLMKSQRISRLCYEKIKDYEVKQVRLVFTKSKNSNCVEVFGFEPKLLLLENRLLTITLHLINKNQGIEREEEWNNPLILESLISMSLKDDGIIQHR